MPPTVIVKDADDPSAAPPSAEDVDAILQTILTAKTSQASLDASYALTNILVESVGFRGLQGYGILEPIKKAATDKKNVAKREGSMFAYGAMFERFPTQQRLSEIVFLLQETDMVTVTLDALADKNATVKESAQYALDALFGNLGPEAQVFALLPTLVKYLGKRSGKWQGAVGAFELIGRMADKAKIGSGSAQEEKNKEVVREALGRKLEGLIPVVEDGMTDLKTEVYSRTVPLNYDMLMCYSGLEASCEDDDCTHFSAPERRCRT